MSFTCQQCGKAVRVGSPQKVVTKVRRVNFTLIALLPYHHTNTNYSKGTEIAEEKIVCDACALFLKEKEAKIVGGIKEVTFRYKKILPPEEEEEE